MTSYELFELHKEVITDLSELDKYISDIKNISKTVSESTDVLMRPLLQSGIDSNTQRIIIGERNKILQLFGGFINNFDMLKNHEIIIKIQQKIAYKKTLERFSDFGEEFTQIDGILKQIEDTTKKIYEYVKTKNAGLLVEVLNSISKTDTIYSTFEKSFEQLNKFIHQLENSRHLENNVEYKNLQIQFYNKNIDYNDFINNLIALRNIYDELRRLFNINGYDLQIIKIESGSLLEILLGHNNVVEVISYLLKKCIDLIFSKYTMEGRLTRKKELMEFLERSAEFPEKCAELGLELDEHDKQLAKENLSKSYAIISKEVLKMITKSAKIKVDNDEFSIQEKLSEKFLEESKILMLSENSITDTQEQISSENS